MRFSSGTMPRITYSAPYRPALERRCSTSKSADIGELAVEALVRRRHGIDGMFALHVRAGIGAEVACGLRMLDDVAQRARQFGGRFGRQRASRCFRRGRDRDCRRPPSRRPANRTPALRGSRWTSLRCSMRARTRRARAGCGRHRRARRAAIRVATNSVRRSALRHRRAADLRRPAAVARSDVRARRRRTRSADRRGASPAKNWRRSRTGRRSSAKPSASRIARR